MTEPLNHPVGPDAPPGTRLIGWKAIAAHLRLGVRTAQRWEREFELPVRRISHDRRDTVFAYVAELDAWLLSSSGAKARSRRWDDDPGSDDSDTSTVGGAGDHADDTRPHGDTPPDAAAQEAAPHPAPRSPGVVSTGPWREQRVPWLIALVAVVAATLAVAGLLFSRVQGSGDPASLRIGRNGIVALDDEGRELWEHPFARLEDTYYEAPLSRSLSGVADLDGNGRTEVWFAVAGANVDREDLGLYLFDHDGRLRWRYSYAGVATYGSLAYRGPWVVSGVHVTEDPSGGPAPALWVVSRDAAEFPCVLQRVDPVTGRPRGAYWSAGWIASVALVHAAPGPRLLVGSAFNEGRAPGLAQLDALNIDGSMPAAVAKYRCVDCPQGDPLTFVVFPKPARFAGIPGAGFSTVLSAVGPDGVITVQPWYVEEAAAVFRMNADLTPLHADVADSYFPEYERRVRAGDIPPYTGPALKPDRELLPILRWEHGAFVPVDVR